MSIIRAGESYGLLTVTGRDSERRGYLVCVCRCGTEKSVRGDHLRGGKIISCGCEHKRRSKARVHVMHEANVTHGKTGTRAYGIWCNMVQRCTNPNNTAYKDYGGRGIVVCERWNDFSLFVSDMGEPSPFMTLDRIDNDKGYSPDNCRWVTRKEQMNNRRNNHMISFGGKTLTLSEWADRLGMEYKTLSARILTGWPIERALTEIPRRRKKRQPS